MTEFSKFAILGLGNGAIYSLVALGIVLVYRGSGVVNFCQASFALVGAAVFFECRHAGTALALVAGVVAAGACGVAINLLLMRPMRKTSPLSRVIATLGVLSLGTALGTRWLGSNAFRSVPPFFPSRPVQPFGHRIIFGEDRYWILGLTVLLTAVLFMWTRRSRLGLATSAVAENESLAAAQGWSPVSVATVNWFLGGSMAGLGGILLATIAGLSINSQSEVVIPALAAALVGAFSSFTLTLIGGLLIGVMESEALHYINPTGFTQGLSTAVPFLVIILILVVRGRALPLRGFLADRLPSVGTGRTLRPVPVTIITVGLTVSLFTGSSNWANAIITSCIFGMVALSLVVLTGYAGQLSLAQWTMAGMGALCTGYICADLWSLPFVPAFLLGILIVIPLGIAFSLPALRVRGVNLAIITLSVAVVLTNAILNNSAYTGGEVFGTVVPTPKIFGWNISSVVHPTRYGLVSLLIFMCGAIAVGNIRRGSSGRRLLAVRDNERAAASMGLSIIGAKVYAFAIATVLAAAGGALVAFRNPNLDYTQFDLFSNINIVILTTIGGIGWIAGASFAGVIAVAGIGQIVLQDLVGIGVVNGTWWNVITAAALLPIIVIHPEGQAPVWSRRMARLSNRLRDSLVPASVRVRRRKPVSPAFDVAASNGASPGIGRVPPMALELAGITVDFGGVRAVRDVSLKVEPGEVVGLIGPNGAGKTSVIDAVTGFVSYRGDVFLGGESLAGFTAQRRARKGMIRSFQSLELLEDLSILDNLRAASDTARDSRYLTDLIWPRQDKLSFAAASAIATFGLSTVLDAKPGELPYAHRRMVAVARAVAAMPSVLLLDEPAAGLDEWSTQELATVVRRLADEQGMAVLLIEHDVEMVMRTCDRIVALRNGSVIASGTPDKVRSDPVVVTSFLGEPVHLDDAGRSRAPATGR